MGLISRVSSRTYRNFNQILKKPPKKIQNGSNARSRQRYGFLSPPIRPKGSQLVQKQGPKIRNCHQHLETSKDGSPTISIGVHLRDQMGISQSKYITGNKILRILKANGVAVDLPEDLYFLIKKAVTMRKHLDKNRKDKHGKFRLILVESRIHRLARYYRTKAVIKPNWKYDSQTAAALVS